MENPNSTISKLIKEAEAKGQQVVVIGAGVNRAAEIRAVLDNPPVNSLIIIEDITELDLEMAKQVKRDVFAPEPFVIKAHPEFQEGIILREEKPYQKNNSGKFKIQNTNINRNLPKKNLGFRGRR